MARRHREDDLRIDVRRPSRLARWAFREWCFARALVRRFWKGWAFLAGLLLAGGWLFRHLEPERNLGFTQSTWYAFSLLLGDYGHGYPESPILQVLFFVVPVLGLGVIAQGLVNLALLVRDRRLNERDWSEIMAASSHDHVILVGLGKLGYRCYRLLRQLGTPVVVVERDREKSFLDEVRRDGTPILVGDARSDDILRAANVSRARSVIVATDDDLANVEIALDSRRMNPGIRVVLRLFDQEMADKIRGAFEIGAAMSQSAISAPAFTMAAVDPTLVNSFTADGRLFVMQRWTVEPSNGLAGRHVGDVPEAFSFSVVKIVHADGTERLFPPATLALQAGDSLLVQGPYEALAALRERGGGPSGSRSSKAAP